MQCVLSIAGSDPSCGAGIQADIKTLAALQTYGLSVLTAVTVQNTEGVRSSYPLPAELVSAQLRAVLDDIPIAAAKTGMLCNQAIIGQLSRDWKSFAASREPGSRIAPLVVDPVMRSQSGSLLLEPEAISSLRESLMPLAAVVTPNIPEAEILAGIPINTVADMEAAGRIILHSGCSWVVVTGGHLSGTCIDVALNRTELHHFEGPRIDSDNDHGTGCAFSAALCAFLAQGANELEAIRLSKAYVGDAILKGFRPGMGRGVLDHFHACRK